MSAPAQRDGLRDPAAAQGAQLIVVTPWPSIRRQARSIAIAAAVCFAVLVTIEFAFFRSGFFATHVAISNPQTPVAKLALAERQPNARVLYVGDSTMMTSVLPTVVSATCACGPGFNGGFSAANPWLTRAMTERLLGVMHPRVVVISVSPWTVDAHARFADSDLDLARQLMSPAELAGLGVSVDIQDRVDAALGDLWSAYGQRLLLKEWFSALAPGQRYDESLLGYWVAPGSANSYSRVVAATSRLFADVGDATPTAAGAAAMTSLVEELRARGIKVVFMLPPLHPAAYELAGPYLQAADVAIRDLATRSAVPVVDCRSVVDATDFRDATHILPEAVDRYSRCVGEQLGPLASD
ncbi:MAG: hypothetical protein E6J13_12460 [Chloroflexi bacterium]|nr:MAG: hypothetical protein E6J13_12460 [Chloroflexota bacterium]